MKNFNMEYHDMSIQEWIAMIQQCKDAFEECLSHFNKDCIKWYRSGEFHDSILKNVQTVINEKSELSILIELEKNTDSGPKQIELIYVGVTNFSIKKGSDAYYSKWREECAYDEFYRSETNPTQVVHEFFTFKDTYFLIEFKHLYLKKKKILS